MGVMRGLSGHVKSPWWRAGAAAALSIGFAGCAQLAPITSLNPSAQRQDDTNTRGNATTGNQVVLTAPTAAPTVAPVKPTAAPASTIRTATVRRGSISDVLLLNGRVAGLDESPLSFTAKGIVDTVYVQPGQSVTEGQTLIDADAKQLQKDLAAAQGKVDAATDSLLAAQKQAADAQRQSAERRDGAVADAQARVDQANAELAKVQAGASQSDRQAVDTAVVLAQNTLDRATADLAKLQAPPEPSGLRSAQQQVASAQVALQGALADQAKLKAGPDASTIREAERALADANAAVLVAQADLDKLNKGPDPYDLRAAQRAVDQALANLDSVSSAKTTGLTATQKDAAVRVAQLAVDDAKDKLARLKQPPDPITVQIAQSKVDDAKAAQVDAQDKLNLLRKPIDQLALDKAQGAVDSAQTTLDNAMASLALLHNGPAPDQLKAAQAAVEAANLALQNAQTRRDEVYGHPTAAELRDAQSKVSAAQAAVERARSGTGSADGAPQNAGGLQRAIDDARKALAEAQSAVDATHLRAPANAVVAQVLVQAGDAVDASKPAIVLAQSNEPLVRVNLLDGDKPKKVDVGQAVKIQVDGVDTPFDGQVVDFAPPAANGDRIALVKVNWGSARPNIGLGARASITVQRKDNTLLVARRAVKTAGARTYVEAMDGTTRKTYPVEVGITTATDVEIVSGVSEGMTLIIDSVIDPSASDTSLPVGRSTGANAGASVAASPTAAPASSAPAVPASSAPAASSDAVSAAALDESFADNGRGWPSDPQSTAWVADGVYHLQTRQAGRFVAIGVPGSDATTTGGTIAATFAKTGGPVGGGYGLIVRDQSAGRDGVTQDGRFYVFEVGDKGEYGIWLRDGTKWIDIVPWMASNAVQPGMASNDLSVTVAGDDMTFSINGKPVAKQVDTQLHHGAMGVFVGGDGNQVAVSHVTVRP